MYTDNEQRTGIPLKTFIISLILIIIFILLLMWLIPMPKNSNNNNNCTNNGNGTCEGIDGLTNRIFNANVQEMKNAAIFYFTTDKLPKNEGDSVKLTLQEMLDLKLLLPFTDKDGNSCSTEESYVLLTKRKDSYELKVNLKCNDEEDYILVTLGCYSYCTTAVCEKQDPTKPTNPTNPSKPTNPSNPQPTTTTGVPKCELYVSSGNVGSNGWYIGDVVVGFKSKTVNGATITNYGLGTTQAANYNKATSYKVNKDGTTTVYGYVKASNGKTSVCSIAVKRDTSNPVCNLTVLQGTKGTNGSYVSDVVIGFSSKTDTPSGIATYGISTSTVATYNKATQLTITKNGTHTIYGYVKDKAGHLGKCNITIKRDKPTTPVTSSPSCSLKVTSGTATNGWYNGNVVIGFASKKSTNGATIKSFGLGTSETYVGNNSYTVSRDGTTTVYGYVKDSNGYTSTCSIVVRKDTTKPSCSLKVISGTYNSNGYYTSNVVVGFNTRTDSTSGISKYGVGKSTTYAGNTSYTITSSGSHTVYGYVMDNAGNTATCSIKVEKRDNLEYQYKKYYENQYSAWSNWTTSTYNPNNPPAFGKYTLIEIENLGKTQEVDYYKESTGKAFYKYKQVRVGTATQTYCKGYDYYRDTKQTTTTYAIKQGTDWKYVGMVTTTGWPTDTLAVKYEFVGFDWKCTGCELTPKKIWNKYTRTVSYATSTNTVTTSGITVSCAETGTKTVEIFDTVPIFVGYEKIKTPVYKDVYRYRQRTRSLVKKAYTDYRWSVYNDTNLLNNGYSYTGNTRIAN